MRLLRSMGSQVESGLGPGAGARVISGEARTGSQRPGWLARAVSGGVDRVFAWCDRDDRFGDLADAVDQLLPLAWLEDRLDLVGEFVVGAEQGRERDLDPVCVVGERERVVLAFVAHRRDDLVGSSRPGA